MRFFACVLLAVTAAAGCGESAAPTYPADAGRDASLEPEAGTDPDASIDGGDLDGGLDGGAPDGGLDGGLPDGGTSWCETSALFPACPDPEALCDEENPCPPGQACVSTGCEDFARCFVVGGGFCETDLDCGDPAYACNLEINRCLRSEPGCEDSNDCVAGFACEDGSCVDRRAPCVEPDDCPHGYTCFFASPDQRFCRRVTRPCARDLDCLLLGVPCGDADDDGRFECMPSLMPTTPDPVSCSNAECSDLSAPVCEPIPEGNIAVCGRFGPCGSAVQCPSDFQCRDLWGDGRAECVEQGGSCVDSRDCSPQSVCATARAGGPPGCVGGVSM